MIFFNEETPKLKLLMYADCKDTVGQTIPYMEYFSQFGEVILVHTQSDLKFFIEHGDMLVVPGGPDVSSTVYSKPPGFTNTRANAHYEFLDYHLLKPWLETGKPTVGVCRGLQTINVARGGTLIQHIIGHRQSQDRDKTTDFMYTDVEGFNIVEINSIHHQAVKTLGKDLEVLGWGNVLKNCPSVRNKHNRKSLLLRKDYVETEGKVEKTADNYFSIVEAFKSTEESKYNIVAFQYHPEEINCEFAQKQIEDLLSSYKKSETWKQKTKSL